MTLAAIIPDIDGAGIILDFSSGAQVNQLKFWSNYHHLLGHNIGFCLLFTLMAFAFANRKVVTSLMVLLSFHIHLFCDLIGSRGPDGYQWPIPWLLPFNSGWNLTWKGQWSLNSWPNFAITLVFIVIVLFQALRSGRSPLEFASQRADRAFVDTLRNRFRTSSANSETAE